jgi:predicted dehydrogenase
VLTDAVDIANARIEFANGAIANVTASRVSTGAQRRFRVFQPNQYVSIDFGSGEVRRVTKQGEWQEGAQPLHEETWNLEKGDALLAETAAFLAAIRADTPCEVSGADGVAALALAESISAEIERRNAR